METIVTPVREGIIYYRDLYEWAKSFGDDPHDPDFDALSYLIPTSCVATATKCTSFLRFSMANVTC